MSWKRKHMLQHVRACASETGQMSVELAVVIPVVIAVCLICYNAGRYAMLCADFDRLAQNACVVYGVSPSGEQSSAHAAAEIKAELASELPSELVTVDVQAEGMSADPHQPLTFLISPLLTRYTCVMKYKPWPLSFVLAGTELSLDIGLEHKKSLVVDRFRPRVVM